MKNHFEWDVIMEEYPHSFKFFRETVFPNTTIVNKSILSLYHVRNLYNFFDSVGVLLTVECIGENIWLGNIQLRSGFSFSVSGSYMNRIDLEVAGFTECFQQLNKRLINLKNKK